MLIKVLATLLVSVALTACGGSSGSSGSSGNSASTYTGLTTAAKFSELSEDEKKEVGEDSVEVISEAVSLSDTDEFLPDMPFGIQLENNITPPKTIERRVLALTKQAQKMINNQASSPLNNLPNAAVVDETFECDLGGSETLQMDFNEETGNGTITLVYKNCKEEGWDFGETELLNGTLTMKITSNENKFNLRAEFKNFEFITYENGIKTDSSKMNGSYEVTYGGSLEDNIDNLNFTAKWNLVGTESGQPFEAKGQMTCSSQPDFNCSYSADISLDGKTYRVEDLVVVDGWSSTEVSGKIHHPDYGYYTFNAQVDYWCDSNDLAPFVGEVTYKDEAEVTFNYLAVSCTAKPAIIFN